MPVQAIDVQLHACARNKCTIICMYKHFHVQLYACTNNAWYFKSTGLTKVHQTDMRINSLHTEEIKRVVINQKLVLHTTAITLSQSLFTNECRNTFYLPVHIK